AECDDEQVAAGIALHHRTDAAFHRLPLFLELYRDTAQSLLARGVARGGARGSAHVAVELLLDGVLTDDPAAARHYLAALAWTREAAGLLHWRQPDQAMRWDHLCSRLQEHGIPHDYRQPTVVAQRVERILAHRPRLALSPTDARAVQAEISALSERVTASAAAIMADLRRRLDSAGEAVTTRRS
ncbi:MAG: hypothetical protein AAGC55_16380, partial [Myxococcota bacterium]